MKTGRKNVGRYAEKNLVCEEEGDEILDGARIQYNHLRDSLNTTG